MTKERSSTTILNHLDPELSEINSLSNEICASIQSACQFLMQSDQLVSLTEWFFFEYFKTNQNWRF